jgi:hypothetical protein
MMTSNDKDFGIHAVSTAEKMTITISREWIGSFLGVLYHAEKRLAIHQAHHGEHGHLDEAMTMQTQRQLVDGLCDVVTEAIMYGVPKKSLPSKNNA